MKYLTKNTILNLLAVAGLLISCYLLYTHWATYNGIGVKNALCDISAVFNCETVETSQWSVIAGMPAAFWGIVAFAFFLFFRAVQANTLADVTAFAMLAASFWFYHVSRTQLGAYCPYCIMIYLITILIAVGITYKEKSTLKRYFRQAGNVEKRILKDIWCNARTEIQKILSQPSSAISALPMIAAVLSSLLFYPHYWDFPPIDSKNIVYGHTAEKHPFIASAKEPVFTIEEYTDYQCTHCLNGQRIIRHLISNGARGRLIHKNYPLSSKCNPIIDESPFNQNSCNYALLAIAALQKYGADKFWAVNDMIFSGQGTSPASTIENHQSINLELLKKEAVSMQTTYHLAGDIMAGIKNSITGTPAYFVDGERKSLEEVVRLLKSTIADKS